jgi:hypothetical protein
MPSHRLAPNLWVNNARPGNGSLAPSLRCWENPAVPRLSQHRRPAAEPRRVRQGRNAGRPDAAANPGAIQAYLDTIAAELAFDPALSRRARAEVEDHLRELAAHMSGSPDAAERQAVSRFGPAQDITAQFAAVSLTRQVKAGGIKLMLGVLGIYAVMKTRVTWWGPADAVRSWQSAPLTITMIRAAFWVALVVGLLGWAYASRTRINSGIGQPMTTRLRRAVLLCAGATAAICLSVAGDAALNAIRLSVSTAAPIPVLLLAIEVLFAALLVLHCGGLAYRTASGTRLLHVHPSKDHLHHDPAASDR